MFELILWIVIGLAALIIDMVTSAFLFIWFTIGAIAAIAAEILGYSFVVQLIVFAVVSIILVIVCYPLVKRKIKQSVKPTPVREKTYVGREIVVDEEMVKNNGIKVDGIYWKVKDSEYVLKKGDRIKILGMEGNKFDIKKV
ncbi:NfeD family protein [Clostridium luticellarii]|jgi:membrane protein implicated in regulation of membrane protease activity|uniref:NfeD family protein n=1 Tax=Clostridium luticellarii TaxID=1691940 RepID=UPI002357319F|nr:NfeD family protein [Clostridium luticellarii]MCI1945045.1 NfeD family protein [Clostridium luticellarii]MCI1967556.1 NfeD family protein [Clostridium luticellarii]MCI1995746.1 NfeD family protein [Clostridium luticellarii]MCI2040084.1 NfeD family protein [Clostridium luticellarii]